MLFQIGIKDSLIFIVCAALQEDDKLFRMLDEMEREEDELEMKVLASAGDAETLSLEKLIVNMNEEDDLMGGANIVDDWVGSEQFDYMDFMKGMNKRNKVEDLEETQIE